MACLFVDGFDHVAPADVALKWTSVGSNGGVLVAGQFFGYGYQLGQSGVVDPFTLHKTFPAGAETTVIWGARVKLQALTGGTQRLIAFYDTDIMQVQFVANSDGTLSGYTQQASGTSVTVAGPSAVAVQAGQWAYVEIKITFHATAGAIEVKINGLTVIDASGINTTRLGNIYGGPGANSASAFTLSGGPHNDPAIAYDDLYFCNTAGSLNNTFLGDVQIYTIFPNGTGTHTEWTPTGAAENWNCADEAHQDGDLTYVSASATGSVDSYAYSNLSASGAVLAVQMNPLLRKDDAGTRTVQCLVRSGSSEGLGGGASVGLTYAYLPTVFETNPALSAAWTVAQINAAEFGQKVES